MPKKKKKRSNIFHHQQHQLQKQQQQEAETETETEGELKGGAVSNQEEEDNGYSNENNATTIHDAITLKVIKGISSSSLSNSGSSDDFYNQICEENERILYIHEANAKSLDLKNNDHVFIIQVMDTKDDINNDDDTSANENDIANKEHSVSIVWNNTNSVQTTTTTSNATVTSSRHPKFVVICKVRIISNNRSTTATATFSKKKKKSAARTRSTITVNEAMIQPYHVSQRLFCSLPPEPKIELKESMHAKDQTSILNNSVAISSSKKQERIRKVHQQTPPSPKETKIKAKTSSLLRVCTPPLASSPKTQLSFVKGGINSTRSESPSPSSRSNFPLKKCGEENNNNNFNFIRLSSPPFLSLLPSSTPSMNNMNTPSTTYSKSSSCHRNSKLKEDKQETKIVVLPMDKKMTNQTVATFFQQQYQWWCCHASNLTLQLLVQPTTTAHTTTISPSLSLITKSTKILEQLVIICCQNQYVTQNDIITISFQGKRIQFRITKTETIESKNHSSRVNNLNEKESDTLCLTRSIKEMKVKDDTVLQKEKQSITESSLLQQQNEEKDSSNLLYNIMDKMNQIEAVTMDTITNMENSAISNFVLYRITFNTRIRFNFNQLSSSSQSSKNTLSKSLEGSANKHGTTTSMTKNIQPQQEGIVAGVDSIIQNIHTLLIPPLLYPERFPRNGPIRAPKGVLLYGNSGCGKSLIAKQVVFDFQKGNVSVYHNVDDNNTSSRNEEITKRLTNLETRIINCADIQSATSIIGEAENLVVRIFEHAEYKAINDMVSTLLVFDDVHLICPTRGFGGVGGGSDRVASTFLALLDGIGVTRVSNAKLESYGEENQIAYPGNVVVLATTSNPSLLDPALRRAGRLDAEVEVPIPDEKTKKDIFSFLMKGFDIDNDVVKLPNVTESDYASLARMAKGFTGADCALCVKEAVREAVLRANDDVVVSLRSTSSFFDSIVKLTCADLMRAIKVTKPSAIKSVIVEVPRVPWSCIGGMEEVKKELREAIELPLTHSHLFNALSITPPRGVLLYGPPGCSKTLMARALATEGNMNFLAVKGPELLSKWLGESERALASLFRRARLASPCVIFFDEIDAIASKRGNVGGGGERMVSQLLTELDGVSRPGGATLVGGHESGKSQPRVVVIGATNRPDCLDEALIRPGRIDKMIYVGLPDQQSREAIFKVALKEKACDPKVDVRFRFVPYHF